MSASQLIEKQVMQTLKSNSIVDDNIARWRFLYESYMGGEDYRKGKHLQRYQLETDREYAARLQMTPLENHCQSVINIYNSFLFREPIMRTYGSANDLPTTWDFLNDSDHDGRHLDAVMQEVNTWSSVFGHVWVLLCKPNVGAYTMADEIAAGVRPYVSILTPLVVLDWCWGRDITGRYYLEYFKYVEDINGDIRTIKEWTPEIIRTWVLDSAKFKLIEQTDEVNQLGKIPAIISYNTRSGVRGLGVSAISDIADMQKFIYNSTSEVAQSISLDSHPSIVTTQDTNIGTGAGAVIRMPENLDPNLKPYVLDFAGANITNIYASIKHTVEQIDKLATVGSVRATETRTLSGVAMETEFQLLNAKLSNMALNLENTEEQLWRLYFDYQALATYDMTIAYPKSFAIRDTSRELDELTKAKAIATDPAIHRAIDERIAQIMSIVLPESQSSQFTQMTTDL